MQPSSWILAMGIEMAHQDLLQRQPSEAVRPKVTPADDDRHAARLGCQPAPLRRAPISGPRL